MCYTTETIIETHLSGPVQSSFRIVEQDILYAERSSIFEIKIIPISSVTFNRTREMIKCLFIAYVYRDFLIKRKNSYH